MSQTIPKTMKAQVVQADKTIKVEEVPVPAVADNEVLVRVIAIAQNPTDWKHVEHMTKPGSICGCEFVGHVVQVGKDVSRFVVGDLVTGLNHGSAFPDRGAFAEYVCAIADVVWKVPENIKPEEAVSMNVGPLTVVQSFYSSKNLALPTPPERVGGVEWLLVYGGSTSVGMYAIQFAKTFGLKVVTTASPRNFDLLKSLGADEVFDYRDPDVVDKIKAATDSSIHYALDTVSTIESQMLTVKTFASGPGKLHVILPPEEKAMNSRKDVKFSISLLYSAFGSPYPFGGQTLPAAPEDRIQVRDWLTGPWIQLVKDGVIKPNPVKLMPGGLAGIPEGFEYMKAGKNSAEKLVYKL
ncbi:zinc-binding oxidoreductase ToxD [Cytidiella melzeri]|nr:zinc-binding oxidoreductase ToxD [Cytidiella melzeri]